MAQKTGKKSRRAVYEGGAWSIGGIVSRQARPPKNAIEAAQRRQAILGHWLPYAEQRAAEQGRWYPGIVALYRAELVTLDALIAAQTTQKPRAKRGRAAA